MRTWGIFFVRPAPVLGRAATGGERRRRVSSGIRVTPPSFRTTIVGVLFFDSADRHKVSRDDMLYVIANARTVIVLREEPEKLLYVGFDSQGQPREVITDTSARTGRVAGSTPTL